MLHFERLGQGRPLLLIHGFCEDLTVWKPIKESLAANFDLILIDLPGFGRSPLTQKHFSLDDVAKEIDKLLNSISVDSYSLAGHSLGGYVALSLAELFPDNVDDLILVHSTALEDSEEKKVNRNRVVKFIENHGVEHFLGQFVPSLFNQDNIEEHKEHIDLVKAMGEQLTAETIIAYTKAMRDRPNRMHILSSNTVQNRFIYGDKDTIFTPSDIKKHSEVLGSKNVLKLSNCGHMGMYESPEILTKFLLENLQ